MKMPIYRFICLAIILLLTLFSVACDQTEEQNSDTSSAKTDSSAVSEEEYILFSNLPERDYGGETITFLVEGDYMDTYKSVEILPHQASYDGLNTAVKERNDLVEERFHVKIEELRTENSSAMVNTLRENAYAGVSQYDIVMPYMADAATLAQDGFFYDLQTLPTIHLEKAYYDQGSVQDLSICGKNYFVTGDLSLLAYDVTHVLLFNKDMIKEYGLESPYKLVEDGKWTIDKLHEMARGLTADTDGESGMSHTDTYGFLVNKNFISSMFIGAGQRFSVKNQNDEPLLAVYSESATNVFDKIFTLVNDEKASGQIDNQSKAFGSSAVADGKTVWVAATETIASKRALFRAVSLNAILVLGEYDCNFGVLPAPKYNEEQNDYFCRVSTLYASCIAIPTNVKNAEMSAVIADAMMQASTDTVKNAYIEVIMKERKIQDDESEEILDLIFQSRVYDFGSVYNWGGANEGDTNSITGFMNDIAFSGTNTFVSKWQSIEPAVQAAMEDTIATYRSID